MWKIKNNNRGISLVELLVALAIGSIAVSAVVVLLSQGVKGYTKQTIATQLQDDANITMNNISDAIMEAKCVDVSNPVSSMVGTPVYNLNFATNSDVGLEKVFIYNPANKVLYVGTAKVDDDGNTDYTEYDNSSILCKNVDSFKVEIIQKSVKLKSHTVGAQTGDQIVGISNPVQIKISLRLKYNDAVREITRVASVRNDLGNITVAGKVVTDYNFYNEITEYFTN